MARGIAAGEGVVSQANTKAFEEGYEASNLGKSEASKERGRWVWDAKIQKLVRPWEYDGGNEEQARTAPIVMDRHYENTSATDGTDIGSRRKHREYMRQNNLTTADDYKGTWAQAQKRREEVKAGKMPSKTRREAIEREFYKHQKP